MMQTIDALLEAFKVAGAPVNDDGDLEPVFDWARRLAAERASVKPISGVTGPTAAPAGGYGGRSCSDTGSFPSASKDLPDDPAERKG
jgi:hypothetical protein